MYMSFLPVLMTSKSQKLLDSTHEWSQRGGGGEYAPHNLKSENAAHACVAWLGPHCDEMNEKAGTWEIAGVR